MLKTSAVRPWIVLAPVLGATLYGLIHAPLWHQQPPMWLPSGALRFACFLIVCAVLGGLSLWLAPRYTRAHLVALTLLVAVALIGPGPVAAVAFLLAGCAALGDLVAALLFGRAWRCERNTLPLDSGFLAILIFTGLAIYVTLLALTAPLRIHYLPVWATLVALPLILNRAFLGRLARFAARACEPVDLPSRWHALPLLVLGTSLLSYLVLIPKPEASNDSLTMHLALGVRLAANHVFPYDPSVFRWSLMPLAGDFSFAIGYMFGGTLAARLLDFALLGLIVLLLVHIIRRWAPAWSAWLAAGIFVSSPLVEFVTTSLFIENAQSGFLLAAFAALLGAGRNPQPETADPAAEPAASRHGYLLLAGLLAGAAVASKLPTLVLALPIVALAAVTVPRRALAVVALFLVIGLPPYVNAWARTGNPVFPFFGHVFPSKYSDARTEVNDQRFKEKPSWRTPYDLTFHSSRYMECKDGAPGFQCLLLLPLVLAIPYRRWPWSARAAFWLSMAAALILLVAQPVLRYLYPALVFSAIAIAVPLAESAGLFRWAVIGCTSLVWILNLLFSPAAGPYHKDFALDPFRPQETVDYESYWVPEHRFATWLDAAEPHANVGMLNYDFASIAYFTGRPYMMHWWSGDGGLPLKNAPNEDAILRFAHDHAIHWFVGYTAESGQENPNTPAQRFFRLYTTVALVSGMERLAHLRPGLEYPTSAELLINPDFQQGLSHWDIGGPVALVHAEHAIRVTETNHAHQTIQVTSDTPYRVAIRARCPEPDTFTRLQVNWYDQSSRLLGASLIPVKCTDQWADYSTVFKAPPGATSGQFYATGHSEKPVLIQHSSMAW
ncbi:MAG: hypothetical protein ABSE21_18215 [Bryobacteraceae bacterium]